MSVLDTLDKLMVGFLQDRSSPRSKRIQTRDSIFISAFMTNGAASPFANSSSTAYFTNTAFGERQTNRVVTTINKRLTSCMKLCSFSTRWRHS